MQVCSQPPRASAASSEISFSVSSSSAGAPAAGPHGWRLLPESELAAATPPEAGAEGRASASAQAASGASEPAAEPAPLEGIPALTAALLGPVRQSLRQVRWEDTLYDPAARAVVRDLIRFVWGQHGVSDDDADL